MHVKLPPIFRRTVVIHGTCAAMLTLITISVPMIWLSAGRYFYYWDLANYHEMTVDKAAHFVKSPLGALYGVIQSTARNYNEIFTLPILPFVLTFGESRSVYIVGASLIYLLPFALVLGAIATKLISFHRTAVFWSAALLTLLTPMAWAPTLMGWPDAGGALIIALAVWVYLEDVALKSWRQILLIGLLAVAAMLFRRHFAYAVTALYIAMALQALAASSAELRQYPRKGLRQLAERLTRICLTGVVSVLTLAVAALPFLQLVLTRDYGVHASYMRTLGENLGFYFSQFGWLSWVIAIIGLGVGCISGMLVRPVAGFLLLFGVVSLAQWILVVRQLGTQYTYHFTLFVVLGLTAAGWISWVGIRGRRRVLLASAAVVYSLINMIFGFAPKDLLKDPTTRSFFSANYRPLVTPDYHEVGRLLTYLRSEAANGAPIYIAASSYALNWDLLRNAERASFGRSHARLQILRTPEVDSRDSYHQALEGLLQAQYVVVAVPFQHHLPPGEQDLVKIVFDIFTENWELADDFRCLPAEFLFDKGVVVHIYKRTQPTSLQTTLRTLASMGNRMEPPVSDAQTQWVILDQASGPRVRRNLDKSYSIKTWPAAHAGPQAVSLLYSGPLSERIQITGRLAAQSETCSTVLLGFSVMDAEYRTIERRQITRGSLDAEEFTLPLEVRDGLYLLLTIQSQEKQEPQACSLTVDRLIISSNHR